MTVELLGYFAVPETKEQRKAKVQAIKEKNRAACRIVQKTKKKKAPKKKQFTEDGAEEIKEAENEDDDSSYEDSDEVDQ